MYSSLKLSIRQSHPLFSSARHRFLASAANLRKTSSLDQLFPSNQGAQTSTGEDGRKWQIMASICLERFPLIAPPRTDLEIRYQKMLRAVEDEKSLLSRHELRREDERRMAKKAKTKEAVAETEDRQIITAQDFEDASIAERKRFAAAPRSPGDDANVQSLNRLLDKKLIFLIRSPFGDKKSWDIPRTALRDGETLAEAAERCLKEYLDISPWAVFYGNAPRKLYKFSYPKPVSEKTGAAGAKVFMFKADLARNAKVTPLVDQYQWLSRDELGTAIKKERYRQSIASFIFE